MNLPIFQIKKQALTSLKGQWGTVVLLTLLVFFITSGIPWLVEMLLSGGPTNWFFQDEVPPPASLASFLVAIFLIPFSISVYWFYLSLVRFEAPQITQVFTISNDAKAYFKLIGLAIVMGIFIFLWSLLFIIPGIIKAIAYSQTYFLMRDHPEYTILQAITESRKRMNGFKGEFFLLNLSFIGWGILALLTFGIGFLWLVPYVYASQATFYNELIFTSKDADDLYF
jgi:uncharacterized membrane protein